MHFSLVRHPSSPEAPVSSIAVEVHRFSADGLRLRYTASGQIAEVRLPAVEAPVRRDGLWTRTCFEAFVRDGEGPSYTEFNFSPSTAFAAYRFSAYRRDMAEAALLTPVIAVSKVGDVLEALVTIHHPLLVAASTLGLSAVIEDQQGRKSYWALAHPDGPPDFHHEMCFCVAASALEGT